MRIPEGIALIEDGAFMHNELETLKIGENLFTISHSAFRHNKLSKLVLPESTQEIQSDAFGENPLTELTFEGMPTFIHRHAFNLGTKEMAGVKVRGMYNKSLEDLLDHHATYIDSFRALRDRPS